MVTDITKELIVVSLTVSKTFPLIMAVSQERLLTFSTDKMLHVPLFAHGIDHSALDWPSAGSTDRHTHLIMAGQTVELPFQLAGISGQLFTAVAAVEVVRVIGVIFENQGLLLDDRVTLLTDVLP